MPDLWTHIIGGDMVIKKIEDRALYELLVENRKYFNFGTQGPDFFFYNDFWPWIKDKKGPDIGSKLHEKKQAEFLVNAFELLKEKEGNKNYPFAVSYFMGVITHFLLDKHIHEIIDKKTKNGVEHKRFELELDCLLVKKYFNKECYKLNPSAYIKTEDELNSLIVDIYYYNITKLHDHYLHINLINNSYQNMLKVHDIFYSPFKVKAYILKFLDRFLSLNSDQYIYANVKDYMFLEQSIFDEIYSLFPQYITESIKVIEYFTLYLKDKKDKQKLLELIRPHFY